jgi:excisionase family DNA binding protein
LVTDNIPILSTLKGWKYGFESPFKADIYYVNTRLFTGNKWGTSNPIMMRDADFGIVRVRAFGIFDFKIVEPKLFFREVSGSDHHFRLDEFADTMRSRIVSVFSDALATAKIPVLDLATRYSDLGDALLPIINPVMTGKYGIEISSFVLENASVPPEVEKAIDARSSMGAVGNLNDYVKFQMAQGMATGGGGAGGTAAELAVGFGIAQQMMAQGGLSVNPAVPPPLPGVAVAGAVAATAAAPAVSVDVMTPAQVAQALGVTEADVIASIDAGDLKGKKIGAQYRVTKAALDEFLAH